MFTCASSTDARRIIRSKLCSKRSRARCVSPCRATSACATFCRARRACCESRADRLRRRQRRFGRARPAAAWRRIHKSEHAGRVSQTLQQSVLPGVGHFAALIRALDERACAHHSWTLCSAACPFSGFAWACRRSTIPAKKRPTSAAYSSFPAESRRFPQTSSCPTWAGTSFESAQNPSRLLDGIRRMPIFISRIRTPHMPETENDEVVATCTHGSEFIAVLERDNINAVQFHPEKSGAAGAQLLRKFLEARRMTLAHRIIPCLDTDGARVVKGVNFVGLRDAGDPVALAARYNAEGADELVVLDIAASRDRRPTFLETIRRVADELAIPLTAGGGIRTLEDARAVVRAGADKVTVNTAAVARPSLSRSSPANLARKPSSWPSMRSATATDGE